jgi:ABC-type uncharacterized transport system YnjBCD substrate-binding protein
MSWDDILAEAKGKSVTFLAWGAGGADPYVQKWWEHLTEEVKKKYDITLTCVEQDQAETQKLTTDIESKLDATYDLFWGLGSAMAPLRAVNGLWGGNQWLTKLDNYKYLDPSNNFVVFDGTVDINGEEVPFQGLNPSLVCSGDSWNPALAWDASEGSVKGLFHNFTELAQWVKANPGQFTYMDPTGQGAFHSMSFFKEALAELTSDGKGGWKTVYEASDSAADRRKKIQDNIDDWYTWGTSSEASEAAFIERADYLWAFLNEIKPNLLQGDGAALYPATAPEMREYVNAGELACVFTTCTQVSNRVADAPANYPANPAIYMLDTTVGSWDYAIITANSKNKAAAMVVANEMIDPTMQLYAFETTGNGYNIDPALAGAETEKAFADAIAGMGALTSTVEDIAAKSYTDKFGPIAAFLPAGWTQKVANA